jgi:hypothetical protein
MARRKRRRNESSRAGTNGGRNYEAEVRQYGPNYYQAGWELLKSRGPRCIGCPNGEGSTPLSAVRDLIARTNKESGLNIKMSDVTIVRINHGADGKSKRRRNVDPLTVAATSASLAYNLSVARDLKELKKGRKNPWERIPGGTYILTLDGHPVSMVSKETHGSGETLYRVYSAVKEANRRWDEVGWRGTMATAKRLAESHFLTSRQKKRKNPVEWSRLITEGAGTALGGVIGAAIGKPIVDSVKKALKSRKNPGGLTWAQAMSQAGGDPKKASAIYAGRKNPTLLLASNPTKRRNKGRPGRKTRKKILDPDKFANDAAYKKALKMYERFFGGDRPAEVIAVEAPRGTPKYLVALGESREVTYKPADHTSKKGPEFFHHFGEEGGDRPLLVTDATGKYLGYVGGSWYITPEGIRD